MNEQELTAIEARANKASNAPWIVESGEYSGANWMIGAVSVFLGGSAWDDKSYYVTTKSVHASVLEGDAKTDAEFIAHAREDVPALIAEVRALRAKLEAVPIEAIALLLWGDATAFGYVEACGAVGNWLVSVSELTPLEVPA